uniref:Capsid protein n=1 Tax=Calopogonium yellow vein tymovirus TaxID=57875 RepID=O09737_9VIRU|nr:virion protein [Calopogonium yellow vein tymovirus]
MDSTSTTSIQPAINTKSSDLPLQSGQHPPSVLQPFQITVASLGTKDLSDSISVAALSSIASYTTLYRHAKLTSLTATIHPNALSVSNPTTVSLVWVPYNSSATSAQILDVYGAKRFCIGGAINTLSSIHVPCNLTNVNPIIKDSVTYTDTPKLLLSSTTIASPPTSPTCTVTISGTITLHSPLLQASSS